MPVSYIQIKQNDTLPASSDTSKAIIGVNTSNQITITDSSGVTTPLTGSVPPYTASYKVYTAKLSDNLDTIIQENTLGFTPSWTGGSGEFAFNFSGSVDLTKVVAFISPNSLDNILSRFSFGEEFDVILVIKNVNGNAGSITQTPIEIRQYL